MSYLPTKKPVFSSIDDPCKRTINNNIKPVKKIVVAGKYSHIRPSFLDLHCRNNTLIITNWLFILVAKPVSTPQNVAMEGFENKAERPLHIESIAALGAARQEQESPVNTTKKNGELPLFRRHKVDVECVSR